MAARKLIEAIDGENKLLKERLETEKRTNLLLQELANSRKSENEALVATIAAENETIAAKDAVITAQEKLITSLQKKKTSIWHRVGDVLIGIAAGAVLK